MWSSPHATRKYSELHPGPSMLWTADQLWQVLFLFRSAKSPWTPSKNHQNLTVPTTQTVISSGGSCIAWVFYLENNNPKNSRWIFLKSNTRYNSVNPHRTIHHVRPLRGKKHNPVNRATEDMPWCRPHWSVCENCISSLHLASFTQCVMKHGEPHDVVSHISLTQHYCKLRYEHTSTQPYWPLSSTLKPYMAPA